MVSVNFNMKHMGQFVDMHEASNNNVSMEQAREMCGHRFDMVRRAGGAVMCFHVDAARNAMKGV